MSDANTILSLVQRQLWVLTAADGDRRGGLVATFVSRASIVDDMPRVLVGLSVRHHTTDLVERSGAFALHFLCEPQLEWVWRFGLASGHDTDKMAGITVRTGQSGAPILDGAPAWLDCQVETSMPTGDRTVFLASVVAAMDGETTRPLTVDRLRELGDKEKLAQMDEQFARDGKFDQVLISSFRQ